MKKILLYTIGFLITLELGVLGTDTYIYCKYKTSKININGQIICKIDNLINFSGMASSK